LAIFPLVVARESAKQHRFHWPLTVYTQARKVITVFSRIWGGRQKKTTPLYHEWFL